MKRTLLAATVTALLAFSCSSDDSNEATESEQNNLEGTWDATELKVNPNTNDDNANFGKQILDHLAAKDCYFLTFTFNSDASVVTENASNDLQINATANGLDVPCPDPTSSNTSTFTYNGEVLTIVDFEGKPLNVPVTVDGNQMEIGAEQLNIPNFNYAGTLVFSKR